MNLKNNRFIHFIQGDSIEILEGETLMDALLRSGKPIASSCGGDGICGKCKVIVASGESKLSPLTNQEKKFLAARKLSRGERLSCQVILQDALGSEEKNGSEVTDETENLIIHTHYW